MPLYEFKCLKCQTYFEMLVMNKDEEVELKCPECKSE
ncbi:MAG: FmdB family zinc ribbon protein, partial [Thermodesulfobacteriota bacterium]|nr:FmdB family zinc ribbon protein [Thermodesulfobacteriota bacterium]